MEHITKRLVNWASILEDETREQAEKTSRLPLIHRHLALMPDAHLGKGDIVGSVKLIDTVIQDAADLLEVIHELRQS